MPLFLYVRLFFMPWTLNTKETLNTARYFSLGKSLLQHLPRADLVLRTDLGHELRTDLLLRMVGISPNSKFVGFPGAVTAMGQVRVNGHLQLPGHPHIFAVGDVNDRPEVSFLAFCISLP